MGSRMTETHTSVVHFFPASLKNLSIDNYIVFKTYLPLLLFDERSFITSQAQQSKCLLTCDLQLGIKRQILLTIGKKKSAQNCMELAN